MSNKTENTPNTSLDTRRLLETATSNLRLLSALVIMFAASAATVFLVAYLSVFDWRLISFIEYTDVLKFGLVALGIAFGVSIFPLLIVQISAYTIIDAKGARNFWILLVLALTLLFAIALYVDWDIAQKRRLDMFLFGSSALTLVLILQFYRSVGLYRRVLGSAGSGSLLLGMGLMWIAISVIIAGLWGTTFAFFVRDSDGFKQDVTLKKDVFKGIGVVMVTSHHIILYSDGKTIVVPSSDLMKIEGGRR